MQPSIAVLVLGYRARSHLEAGVVDSIRIAASRLPFRYRIIYLDNYSRDGSVQWLTGHYPDIDVLLAPYNTMYCRGVNTLIQYAAHRYDPTYYLLVDADNPADPDAYRYLVHYMEANPQCGIAQPLVKSLADKELLYSCGHVYGATHWCRTRTELPADLSELADLPSCSISSTVVRGSVFESCGVLDEIFEIYYESSDIGFRARAAGYKCACVPGAVSYNEGTEATTVDSIHHRYYFNRNRIIFWRLHDQRVFSEVAEEASQELHRLNQLLEESEFGLDATSEGIRRGLASGLEVANRSNILHRPRIGLRDFDKTKAVVLQTGAPKNG